jgi:hypothetical protein
MCVDESKMGRSYGISFLLRLAKGPSALLAYSYSLLHLPAVRITKMRDFVAGLARVGKSADDIKIITDDSFGDNPLEKTAIYIIKKVKAGQTTNNQ